MSTKAYPTNKPIVDDELPMGIFLQDEPTPQHEKEIVAKIEARLRPATDGDGDLNDSTSNVNDTVSSNFTSATTTISMSGNIAAAIHTNKGQQYIDVLRSCCIHFLRFGTCQRKSCLGHVYRVCVNFKARICSTTKFRHNTFLHILPSCTIALNDGECFDATC